MALSDFGSWASIISLAFGILGTLTVCRLYDKSSNKVNANNTTIGGNFTGRDNNIDTKKDA